MPATALEAPQPLGFRTAQKSRRSPDDNFRIVLMAEFPIARPGVIGAACSIVMISAHCFLTHRDAKSAIGWVQRFFDNISPSKSRSEQELRVDEAMKQLTEENFVIASRLVVHALSAIFVGLVHMDCRKHLLIALTVAAYTVHTACAQKWIRMSARDVKSFVKVSYVTLFVFMLETGGEETHWWMLGQTIRVTIRATMVVVYAESNLHVPGQIGLSIAEVIMQLAVGDFDKVLVFACCQAFLAVFIICQCIMLESYLRDNLAAEFRSADAEFMLSGFRRMLGGICDGEVLLDGELRIHGRSSCLNRLLSTSTDLDGTFFPDLLVDSAEERLRFDDFIRASSQTSDLAVAATASRSTSLSTPPCLRISLQSKSASRVGVDLFHVPLEHLYGSDGKYHLLAMKHDVEPEPVPDASMQDMPRQLLRQALHRRGLMPPRPKSTTSDASGSSLLRSLPALTEIMLLVDASKPHQDVQQVHLNYKPSAARSEVSEIPSLRKFIRPTDWETVRRQVRHYAGKVSSQSSVEPKHLKQAVWFRMLDNPSRYMLARTAKLSKRNSASETDSKLWIYLSDFVGEQSAPMQVDLEGIHES